MTELTLDRARAGLHFSASALKSFLICPAKFRYHYVEGATPEFRPSAPDPLRRSGRPNPRSPASLRVYKFLRLDGFSIDRRRPIVLDK